MTETEFVSSIPLETGEDEAGKKNKSYRFSKQTIQKIDEYRKQNDFATYDATIQDLLDKANDDSTSPNADAFLGRVSNAIKLISAECDAFARLYDAAEEQARVKVMQEISDQQQALYNLRIDEKQARDALVQAEKDNQALNEENQRLTARIEELQKTDDRMRELEKRNTVLEEALNNCRHQAEQYEQIRTENIQLRSELSVYKEVLAQKNKKAEEP